MLVNSWCLSSLALQGSFPTVLLTSRLCGRTPICPRPQVIFAAGYSSTHCEGSFTPAFSGWYRLPSATPACTYCFHTRTAYAFEVALSPPQLSNSRLRTFSTVCVAQRVTDTMKEIEEEEPHCHNYGVFDIPVGFPAAF
jgi:hypothetical protein